MRSPHKAQPDWRKPAQEWPSVCPQIDYERYNPDSPDN